MGEDLQGHHWRGVDVGGGAAVGVNRQFNGETGVRSGVTCPHTLALGADGEQVAAHLGSRACVFVPVGTSHGVGGRSSIRTSGTHDVGGVSAILEVAPHSVRKVRRFGPSRGFEVAEVRGVVHPRVALDRGRRVALAGSTDEHGDGRSEPNIS